jgi:hypothetical protein
MGNAEAAPVSRGARTEYILRLLDQQMLAWELEEGPREPNEGVPHRLFTAALNASMLLRTKWCYHCGEYPSESGMLCQPCSADLDDQLRQEFEQFAADDRAEVHRITTS